MTRDERIQWLESTLTESIVILDGGMGTKIRLGSLNSAKSRGILLLFERDQWPRRFPDPNKPIDH